MKFEKSSSFILNTFMSAMLFIMNFSSIAQCNYDIADYDFTKNKVYLESRPLVLDIFETPSKGRLVVAKLIREQNNYFIDLEITHDSNSQKLKPICFKKGSRLSFMLKNNLIVTLVQLKTKLCGIAKRSKNGFYTVSNYARFVVTQDAYNELIKEQIILMKVISEDYTKKFVLKSEIEEEVNGEIIITKPTHFFIDNIECMTNPKVE